MVRICFNTLLENTWIIAIENEFPFNRKYLESYKTDECKYKKRHNIEECFYYHNNSDKRRKIQYNNKGWNYYPLECTCSDSACRLSHNFFEINYHPLTYKTKDCNCPLLRNFNCSERGERCWLAHSMEDFRNLPKLFSIQEEVKIEPEINISAILEKIPAIIPFDRETYKTINCPDSDCEKNPCMFYHCSLERRRPNTYSYFPEMCKEVFIDGKYGNVENCPQGDACKYCHKRNPCKYGETCPDLHITTQMTVLQKDNERFKKVYEANAKLQALKVMFFSKKIGRVRRIKKANHILEMH